jgi:hypothetical protein
MIVSPQSGSNPQGCGKLATFHVVAGDIIPGRHDPMPCALKGRWNTSYSVLSVPSVCVFALPAISKKSNHSGRNPTVFLKITPIQPLI